MNRKFKTIVLDLDGTLTNSNKELSERNKNALIELQKQGVRVVLASGRPTYGIVPLAEELELSKFGGYILAYNGGVIIECDSNKEVYSQVLPMELIPLLHSESKDAQCVILSYDNQYIIAEDIEQSYVLKEAFLNKMELRRVDNFTEAIAKPVAKCLSVADPQRILILEERLKSLCGDKINIYRSEPYFLELVPQNIDKAYSLSRLLEHINQSREDIIAFGDGFNDLSMIEFAGVGVAMANAQEIVKQSADAVTLSNDEDGVAHYLETHLL